MLDARPSRTVTCPLLLVLAAFAAIGVPARAFGQSVFEAVGERALGMAGAFVAVANDPTAAHWNPAGLVGAGPAGMTIGWHRFQVGNLDGPAVPLGSRGTTSLTSLGTWPLGVSFGTFNRASVGSGEAGAERLLVRHFGVTVLQSLYEGLVVGSTVRILRGGVGETVASGPTLGAVLDHVPEPDDLDTSYDLDLGVMATAPNVRIGFAWRNLRSPSFRATSGTELRLDRQARLGLSVLPRDGVTLAIDVDLNTVDLMGDLRRMCALGAETKLGSRFFVRAGVRWNLADESGPTGAWGASFGIRRSFWLDGHYTTGGRDEDREFGAALRAGF